MKIVVASNNPVKLDSARQGFMKVFPEAALNISGVSVPSGVSDQPMTDAETLQGALNRARSARSAVPDADYWLGIEGGVDTQADNILAFAWVVVMGAERVGKGRTGAFVLPEEVSRLIREGMELGHADDVVFGRSNSKQENGSIGILTHNLMDRASFYAEAVVLALIPFINPDLTF